MWRVITYYGVNHQWLPSFRPSAATEGFPRNDTYEYERGVCGLHLDRVLVAMLGMYILLRLSQALIETNMNSLTNITTESLKLG